MCWGNVYNVKCQYNHHGCNWLKQVTQVHDLMLVIWMFHFNAQAVLGLRLWFKSLLCVILSESSLQDQLVKREMLVTKETMDYSGFRVLKAPQVSTFAIVFFLNCLVDYIYTTFDFVHILYYILYFFSLNLWLLYFYLFEY